jgi:hypothetical protein
LALPGVAHQPAGRITVTSGEAMISPSSVNEHSDGRRYGLPTSVLLAVLAAAGLLALAPALVRRYDATERLEAERAQPTARVLSRTRRRRTVPGRRPINSPLVVLPTVRVAAPPTPLPVSAPLAVVPRSAPPARRPPRPRYSPTVYRRRRVLAALLILNAVELIGVAAVGPGFWVSFAVTATLLVAFLVHLRNLALADRRRRRAQARRRAWLAAQQARVRREQDRRAAQRRAAARRMAEQRESLRRAVDGWSSPPTVSYRRVRSD